MVQVRDLVMRVSAGSGELTIVDGLNLDVDDGELVVITGPSGSGKSTLLGLLAGLDRPTSGSIVVAGTDVGALDEDALARFRRETIGYVFQSYHLIPTLTAIENVAIPLELDGAPDPLGEAARLLADVGLAHRARHHPATLSGGEQQRAAIARAVALRPPLLLADEPTGNLDSATGADIIELLLRLRREAGSTLVLVTHDASLAAHAEHLIVLRDGRIADERRLTPTGS